MEVKRGVAVTVRTAFGTVLERVALSGIETGRDFPVVWVCMRDEWQAAMAEGSEPEGLPWPAEDVAVVDRTVGASA